MNFVFVPCHSRLSAFWPIDKGCRDNRKDFFRNLLRYFKHPNVKLEKAPKQKGPDLGLTGTSLSVADIWSDTNLILALRGEKAKRPLIKKTIIQKKKKGN